MQKVTKAYRGVPAIKDIDFDLRPGEIHALLGENGAGKSTLTKIMAGVVEPTSGRDAASRPPRAVRDAVRRRWRAGIAMVFQETSLVPSMTVAQNLYLGDESFLNRLRGIYIAAQQFLQSLNFTVDPSATVATLGAAKRQMVEIARAVQHNAAVIIFDEPTAVADAGGEAAFLRADAAPEGSAASPSSSSRTRWRRRSPTPTASPSCATASCVVTDDTAQVRPRQGHPRHGRPLAVDRDLQGPADGNQLRQRRREGAERAGHLAWATWCATTPSRSMTARSPACSA